MRMQERVPRSPGELMSDAMALLRRHFKALYLLALPFCAGEVVLREAGQSAFQVLRTRITQDPTHIDADVLIQGLIAGAGGFGLLVGSLIVLQLLSAGVVNMAGVAWHGTRAPTLSDAFGAMATRGAALIATVLMFFFAFLAVIILPMVVVGVAFALDYVVVAVLLGIAALAFMVVASVVITLRWGLMTQTVVLEQRTGPRALARSTELMAGRGLPFFEGAKFKLSLLFLITFAISGTLQSLFAVPRLVIAFASGWNIADGMPPLASMPVWFIIPFGLLEVATNALLVPFSSALMTLFYYDLRVRYEALDLDAAPASVGAASPESSAATPGALGDTGGPPAPPT